MSNYIGEGPISRENRKFFYKITRNSDNDLILTKINTNASTEEIVLNDPSIAGEQHVFQGFGTDYTVINTDANHEVIDDPLGVSQYMIRNDDVNYYIDENGNFIARINKKYNY